MDFKQSKAGLYSAIVWILAGVSLVIYCVLGMLNAAIPGVEDLVAFLSTVEGKYIYIAAFISIVIEGLYFIGSFFPGSTLVLLLAILSQVSGTLVFVCTILTIFIGWCLASVVNIFLAKTYHLNVARLHEDAGYKVQDRIWTTWFPAFRANYEVAQITEGGNPTKVFLSSVRVKFWASSGAAMYVVIVPIFVDVHEMKNEEGFVSIAVIALISFIVGFIKLKNYFSSRS